ncbi:hypothetical protein [Salinigranum halophilum]|jgi:hypothetical protein|uniref:hypothetical protein n=1 Tax=Salinigranum halophilum TaxID=2565931 RepID=UPI0010A7F9D0|nr:hypothetical protein [Salinigranum halophilum]
MSRGTEHLSTDPGRLKAVPDVAEQLLRVYWWLRKTVFTHEKTDNPYLVVELTKSEAQEFFGRHHFEPGWEMSYSFRGEILNLRRVEWAHVPAFPDLPWWQVHIRGYRHDDPDGLELTAHFEPEPAEHPEEHLEHLGIDVPRGNAVLQQMLDEAGIAYTTSPDWSADPTLAEEAPWTDDTDDTEGVGVEVE